MKKKSKCFKKVACLTLATILTTVPVLSTALVTKAANPVILAPENMVQFDIVDEDGNALDGVAYTVTNSAGVDVAAFDSDGSFRELNDSGIESDDTFMEGRSNLKELVAPAEIEYISYENVLHSDNVVLSSGEELDIRLHTLPVKDVVLTVPANTVMVNVDAKWANGISQLELTTNNTTYDMNGMAGTLTSVPASVDGVVGVGYWASHNGYFPDVVHPADDYTLPTEETQYVKVCVKASYVTGQFNDEGLHARYDGTEMAVASGQSNPGESVLWIVSGSVINMPVPDENGYIEFYVEASERKYQVCVAHHWQLGTGGGHDPISKIAYEPVDMTVRAIDFPTDVKYMTFVPADTYTINVTSVPNGYEIPDPITFTVQDSQQFQTAKIEVAKTAVHQHSFTNEYSSDADNHWNTCACGATGNVAAHVPGPAATEQSAQTCTVCGYEIAPMLQHAHSYGTTYESDADNHWNECACGADGNVAAHSFEWITDKPATTSEAGSKHEECSVCGYEKAPVEIPKLTTDGDSNNNTNNNTSNNTNTNTNNAGSTPVQNPVTEEVKDDVPETGDSPVIPLAVAGCIVALGGIAVLIYFKKKENA